MPDHVCRPVSDLVRTERFYDAVFAALGVVKVGSEHNEAWIGYGGRPGRTRFAPYHASYYAAFLCDPDGNRIEAVCHQTAKD